MRRSRTFRHCPTISPMLCRSVPMFRPGVHQVSVEAEFREGKRPFPREMHRSKTTVILDILSGLFNQFINFVEESTTICSTIPAIATQPAEPRRNLPTIPVTVRKQNTEGLEEKFGKFGLPPQDPTRYSKPE